MGLVMAIKIKNLAPEIDALEFENKDRDNDWKISVARNEKGEVRIYYSNFRFKEEHIFILGKEGEV